MPQFKRVDEQGRPASTGFKRVDEAGQVAKRHVGASGSWQDPEPTGIGAGISRGIENLKRIPRALLESSPLYDLVKGQQALKAGKAEEYAADSNARFRGGLEQVAEHPILGPTLGEFAERLPKDPSGTLAEAVTTIGLPAALLKGVPAAGRAVKPAANSFAERLYESALKPGPRSNSLADVQRMVRTGLDEGIPVSAGGTKKLKNLQSDLNAEVGRTITDTAPPINSFDVARRLNAPAQKFAKQVNPTDDLNTISGVGNEFLETQPHSIRPTLAQELKQGTYQRLKDAAFGEVKTASKEGQKALARGLKEELEARFPEIQGLNKRNANLFNLQGELDAAVNRSANHNIFGIGTQAVGAGVGVGTGSLPAAAAAGFIKEVIGRPAVKSRLAITLARLAKKSP